MGQIEDSGCNASQALSALDRNTTGAPGRMVKDMLVTSTHSVDTFNDVLADLDKRFGSDSVVTNSILTRLNKIPKISSPSQIIEMQDLLSTCRSIMGSMDACPDLQLLNFRFGLRRIWEKMPNGFISRWRKETARTERETNRPPSLGRLYQSISDFIDEHSDPTFDSIPNSPKSKAHKVLTTKNSSETENQRSDFMKLPTKVSESSSQQNTGKSSGPRSDDRSRQESKESRPFPHESSGRHCLLHNTSGHELTACYKFKNLTYDDRRSLAIEHRLRFKCLGPHIARICKTTVRCPLCRGSHHELMHRDSTTARPSEQSDVIRSNCIVASDVRGTTEKCYSKTVPVQVRLIGCAKIVNCLCIIDEQSNASFCAPILPEALGCNSTEGEYILSTMSSSGAIVRGSRVRNLEVKGFNESNWIPLPELLSHPSIPDTSEELATRDVVLAHKHIRHLADMFASEKPDFKVLLLLGVNSGEAMFTRAYGSKQPYAHHTALGWSLVGSTCLGSPSERSTKTTLKVLRTTTTCEPYVAGCSIEKEKMVMPAPCPAFAFRSFPVPDAPDLSIGDRAALSIRNNCIAASGGRNSDLLQPVGREEDFEINSVPPVSGTMAPFQAKIVIDYLSPVFLPMKTAGIWSHFVNDAQIISLISSIKNLTALFVFFLGLFSLVCLLHLPDGSLCESVHGRFANDIAKYTKCCPDLGTKVGRTAGWNNRSSLGRILSDSDLRFCTSLAPDPAWKCLLPRSWLFAATLEPRPKFCMHIPYLIICCLEEIRCGYLGDLFPIRKSSS